MEGTADKLLDYLYFLTIVVAIVLSLKYLCPVLLARYDKKKEEEERLIDESEEK